MKWMLANCVGLLWLVSISPAKADQNTGSAEFYLSGTNVSAIPSLTETARLDFKINIEKILYLRVGAGASHNGGESGTGPASSASVSTVTLNLTPTIPSGTTTPLAGDNQSVNWNTGPPTFQTLTTVALPVEVRSNAGAVKISSQVTSPLTSGSDTISMSSVTITSSDNANLPAPMLPNSGTGTAVNVAPGGVGTSSAPTLLTYRTANWSFGFTPTPTLAPGTYSGSVTFTATAL